MIEGQPQLDRASAQATIDCSGLVIEGQPQLSVDDRDTAAHCSGLVIEGQPQHFDTPSRTTRIVAVW